MHTYYDNGSSWDVAALWKAAEGLPSDLLLISDVTEIDNLLDTWPWEPETTLRGVIAHMRKVEAADLSYPIILTPAGAVADGCHRIAKVLLRGGTHILAVRLDKMPPPLGR